MTFVFAALCVAGILLVFPYQTDENDVDVKQELLNNDDLADKYGGSVMKALFSKEYIMVFTMTVCSACKYFDYLDFSYMVLNVFRFYGQNNSTHKIDQTWIKTITLIFSLANGLTRPLWGLFFDKYGFKLPFFIIQGVNIVVSATYYFVVRVDILFAIVTSSLGIILAGHFALIPSLVSRIFGLK